MLIKKYIWLYAVAGLCVGLFVLGGCRVSRKTPDPSQNVTVVPGTFKNSVGMTMVKLSTEYYVSKYETCQFEFELVMGYNPSKYSGTNHPVETITGSEAEEFCRRLTQRERENGTLPEGYVYDLPTFAQWMEYVADASLDNAVVPGAGKTFGSHQAVGSSGEINRLGLYDLRGNVSEYTKDVSRYYNSKIIVGAYWNTHRKDYLLKNNQCSFTSATEKDCTTGFRCVLIRVNTP